MLCTSYTLLWLSLISFSGHVVASPANLFFSDTGNNSAIFRRKEAECKGRISIARASYNDWARSVRGLSGTAIEGRTEDIIKRAALRPGQNVLDLGAGLGDIAIEAKKKVGKTGRVVAVDFAHLVVEVGKESSLAEGQDVEWYVGEVNHLGPLLRRLRITFDVIILANAIQFVNYPERTLKAWGRHLRPGGRIMFDVMPQDVNPEFRAVARATRELGLEILQNRFLDNFESEATIAALIQRAGFQSSVYRSPVFATKAIARELGISLVRNSLDDSTYGCFRTEAVEQKAFEIFNAEFDRRKTSQGFLMSSLYYYDAVATKPDRELR